METLSGSDMVYDMIEVDSSDGVLIGPMAVWKKVYRIKANEAGVSLMKEFEIHLINHK